RVGGHEGRPLRGRGRGRPGRREHLGARVEQVPHHGGADPAGAAGDERPPSRELSLFRPVLGQGHANDPFERVPPARSGRIVFGQVERYVRGGIGRKDEFAAGAIGNSYTPWSLAEEPPPERERAE